MPGHKTGVSIPSDSDKIARQTLHAAVKGRTLNDPVLEFIAQFGLSVNLFIGFVSVVSVISDTMTQFQPSGVDKSKSAWYHLPAYKECARDKLVDRTTTCR